MGDGLGIHTTALLTRMDSPMGRNVGNALEVIEAIECLNGGGPSDLIGLTCQLGKFYEKYQLTLSCTIFINK